MRRLFAVLFLLFSTPAFAFCDGPSPFEALPQADQAALRAEAARDPFGAGLLWQVSRDGVTSYVVGTMHLPNPRHDAIMEATRPLLDQVDQLVLEITEADGQQMQTRMTADPAFYLLTEGGSLIDRLPPDEWAKLAQIARDRGVPPFMAATMKPWFLSMSLAIPSCATTAIQAGMKGLDRRLEVEATAKGLPTHSLDEVDALLHLLAGDPLDKQIADLRRALAAGLLVSAEGGGELALYFQQETLLMWRSTLHMARAQAPDDETRAWVDSLIDEMEAKLLDERNLAWAPQILAHAAARPTLIAVGGAHLFGETGVLAQLQAAGFTVSRMPLSIP